MSDLRCRGVDSGVGQPHGLRFHHGGSELQQRVRPKRHGLRCRNGGSEELE